MTDPDLPKHALTATYTAWVLAELWVMRRDRRPVDGESRDRGSLVTVVVGLAASLFLGFAAVSAAPGARIAAPPAVGWLGLAAAWLGLSLRVWAVATLGRFFRRTVVVQSGHRLVEDGPYRLLRHPSYSGLVLLMAGLGLALGNWLSLAIMTLGALGALVHRIRTEEAALHERFGEAYLAYRRRTWALIPGLW